MITALQHAAVQKARETKEQLAQFATLEKRVRDLQLQIAASSRAYEDRNKKKDDDADLWAQEVKRRDIALANAEKEQTRLLSLLKAERRQAFMRDPDGGNAWMPAKPQAAFARHLAALNPLRLQVSALVRKLGEQRGLQREEKIATRNL